MSATRTSPDNSARTRRLLALKDSLANAVEVDRGTLYFVCLPEGRAPLSPRDSGDEGQGGLFCGTDEYVYQHFFADFGPLNLGHLHAFCRKLGRMMECGQQEGKGRNARPVYVYSSDHAHRRSNAVVLVLAYAVLHMGKTAEEAYAPFFGIKPPLTPYRDASFGICTYHLEVLDCARAIARAASLSHINLDFKPNAYTFYDKIENGDINWIIPAKFLAFSGPLANRREIERGKWTLVAEDYVPIFRKLGVTCVIRFNKKCYDRRRFIEGGIHHVDLFYEDGGNPSEEILQKFLRICEETEGVIAVHCKAGLGRTGTNIALFMMKHFGYSAAESIALCRICRPGSIVGPQQQFLHDLEHRMRREGDLYRRRHGIDNGDGVSHHLAASSASASASGRVRGRGGDALGRPSAVYTAERRPMGRFSRANSNPTEGEHRERVVTVRRPTTSPLLMPQQSAIGGGGRDGGGGSGVGGRRAIGLTRASRHGAGVGNRWVSGEETLVVRSGGHNPRGGGSGGGGDDGGGGGGGSGGAGGGGGGGVVRGRGRGRCSDSRSDFTLQRPRRGSPPTARNRSGGGAGGGTRGGRNVEELMGVLRLSSAKGGAAATAEGRDASAATAAAAVAADVAVDLAVVSAGSSPTRGKLVPLAVSSARCSTAGASSGGMSVARRAESKAKVALAWNNNNNNNNNNCPAATDGGVGGGRKDGERGRQAGQHPRSEGLSVNASPFFGTAAREK